MNISRKTKTIIIIIFVSIAAVTALVLSLLFSNDKDNNVDNIDIEQNIIDEKEIESKTFGVEQEVADNKLHIVTTNSIIASMIEDITGTNENINVAYDIKEITQCDILIATGSVEDRWVNVNIDTLHNDNVVVINITNYSSEEFNAYMDNSNENRGAENIKYTESDKEYTWLTYEGAIQIYGNIAFIVKSMDRENKKTYENNLAVKLNEMYSMYGELSTYSGYKTKITGFNDCNDIKTVADAIKYNNK